VTAYRSVRKKQLKFEALRIVLYGLLAVPIVLWLGISLAGLATWYLLCVVCAVAWHRVPLEASAGMRLRAEKDPATVEEEFKDLQLAMSASDAVDIERDENEVRLRQRRTVFPDREEVIRFEETGPNSFRATRFDGTGGVKQRQAVTITRDEVGTEVVVEMGPNTASPFEVVHRWIAGRVMLDGLEDDGYELVDSSSTLSVDL